MKYFKLCFGFDESEYIPITANELPKALALFMEKTGRAVFEEGAIRGQDIIRITEDWHKEKGWSQGYKMLAEDFNEIEPLKNKYRETFNKARIIAEYAIKEDRRDLLLIPPLEALAQIPQQERSPEIEDAVKKLAESKTIKP